MTKIKIQATIREQVYDILKERILSGYYPGGTHLSEQQICSELNISRSPVREAIRLLEADGLLAGEANKGVTVRIFTEQDVRNMYQVEDLVQNGSIRFGFKTLIRNRKTGSAISARSSSMLSKRKTSNSIFRSRHVFTRRSLSSAEMN